MTVTYVDGNPAPVLEQSHKCGGFKSSQWDPNSHLLDNWITKDNTDIRKQLKKPARIHFHTNGQCLVYGV